MNKQDEVERAAENAWMDYEYRQGLPKSIFIDAYKLGLAHQNQWRRVEDGLPETKGRYLVTVLEPFEDIRTTISFFINGCWNREVIAWMPPPEPYKGENE